MVGSILKLIELSAGSCNKPVMDILVQWIRENDICLCRDLRLGGSGSRYIGRLSIRHALIMHPGLICWIRLVAMCFCEPEGTGAGQEQDEQRYCNYLHVPLLGIFPLAGCLWLCRGKYR